MKLLRAAALLIVLLAASLASAQLAFAPSARLGAGMHAGSWIPIAASATGTPLAYAPSTSALVGLNSVVISTVARSGGLVSATTATALTAAPGQTIYVTGVTDASYDGGFSIISASGTSLTWDQTGPNSSSSGGSVGSFYPIAVDASGNLQSSYTLPIATTSILGGVKPDGVTCAVNGSTGVLSCGGAFTAAGDLSGSNTSQTVVGLDGTPFCTGYAPTNGEAVTLTTAGSPNPCYTAAIPAAGELVTTSVSDNTNYYLALWTNNADGYQGGVVASPTYNPSTGALTLPATSSVAVGGGSPLTSTGPGGALASGAYVAAYSLPNATTSVLGGVKPDGTTCTTASGVITCVPTSADAAVVTTTVSSGSISVSGNANVVICTTTCTVTPIAPAAGVQLCVRNAPGSATVITMAALGSGNYYELTSHAAWGTANHTTVSGGVATDQICFVGYDANHYAVASYNGTWTD